MALQIHRELGPGLLEKVYETVLAHELLVNGMRVERQAPISFAYQGIVFDEGFRADLIVEDKMIVELKCVDNFSYAHQKHLLNHLRISGKHLGYLSNFNAGMMKYGTRRVANRLVEITTLKTSAPTRLCAAKLCCQNVIHNNGQNSMPVVA